MVLMRKNNTLNTKLEYYFSSTCGIFTIIISWDYQKFLFTYEINMLIFCMILNCTAKIEIVQEWKSFIGQIPKI